MKLRWSSWRKLTKKLQTQTANCVPCRVAAASCPGLFMPFRDLLCLRTQFLAHTKRRVPKSRSSGTVQLLGWILINATLVDKSVFFRLKYCPSLYASKDGNTYLSGDMIIEHSGPPNKINLTPKSIFHNFEVKKRQQK